MTSHDNTAWGIRYAFFCSVSSRLYLSMTPLRLSETQGLFYATKFDMKRPDTGKTFLDFDDINKILPKELKLNSERHSRGVYCATNGCLISISNSKIYEKGYLAWYYVYADRYADLGVKYMLFTLGLRGVVLVPMEVIQSYKIGCSWKEGMRRGEKRYRIDITKKDGKYLFVNSSQRHQNRLDITPFFIPFENK